MFKLKRRKKRVLTDHYEKLELEGEKKITKPQLYELKEVRTKQLKESFLKLNNEDLKEFTYDSLRCSILITRMIGFEIHSMRNPVNQSVSHVLTSLMDGAHNLPFLLKRFEQGEIYSEEIALELAVLYSTYYLKEDVEPLYQTLQLMEDDLKPIIDWAIRDRKSVV